MPEEQAKEVPQLYHLVVVPEEAPVVFTAAGTVEGIEAKLGEQVDIYGVEDVTYHLFFGQYLKIDAVSVLRKLTIGLPDNTQRVLTREIHRTPQDKLPPPPKKE